MDDLATLAAKLRNKIQTLPSLGYKAAFVLEGTGMILWDGTQQPPVVTTATDTGDAAADTILRLSGDHFAKLLAGELDPTLAYMSGKLKVDGSLGVAMKINSLLGD